MKVELSSLEVVIQELVSKVCEDSEVLFLTMDCLNSWYKCTRICILKAQETFSKIVIQAYLIAELLWCNLAIDSGGNVSDLVVMHNCCTARMLPGEAESVSE